MITRTFRVRAHAKVNLDLRVLHRRGDGYHEIRTIFQTIELHDTLAITPRRGAMRLVVEGGHAPADQRNIVWKAARALWLAAGRSGEPRGMDIRLVKRIPAQAGLGGGSSDAAAALAGLNRLWDLALPSRMLYEVAAGLGSDVPFFLLGGTALGTGRGEVLYPLPDLRCEHVVVARPREGVSTADAYAWLASGCRGDARVQRLAVTWPPGSIEVANDFERPVSAHVPAIAGLLEVLRGGAYFHLLSGSGSAVFGLFRDERSARRQAGGLRAAGAEVWMTRFRPRAGRRRLAR